jgi:hypothetical protein
LTVIFWAPTVVSVKPDEDTLLTVPTEPPAAGPDRALDPLPPPAPPAAGKAWPLALLLAAVELLLAPVELLLAAVELLLVELEEQATIPREPPPITIAVIPVVKILPRLLENISFTPCHLGC